MTILNRSSSSGEKLANTSCNSVAAQVPGGVVTTQNISTVIRPRSNNNSLQFVKIQTPELSKTAVEQIRIAEETKITKSKIKEVEEEWQNNLLSWKSKRRQQIGTSIELEKNDPFDTNDTTNGRKIKTFAEMIEERAKSGNRLGFHLQRYLGTEDDDIESGPQKDEISQYKSGANASRAIKYDSQGESEIANASPDDYQFSDINANIPHSVNNLNLSPPKTHALQCDNEYDNVSSERELTNQHSVSLLDKPQADQLNSTFIQDLLPDPVPERPPLMVETQAENLSRKHLEDSEGSAFEDDDDEEQEEQKQQQRIAFESIVKAFENLTSPKPTKPSFTPARPARNSSQTQPVNSSKSPPIVNRPIRISVAPPQPASLIKAPANVNMPPIEPKKVAPILSKTIKSPPYSNGSKLSPVQSDKIHHKSPALDHSPKKSPANLVDQIRNLSEDPQCGLPEQVPKKLPIPDTPRIPLKNLSSPKRPTTQDEGKEKNVLSVSGKKRCSSCKEELGRGAAAFVVESLSLVYHTNCFRCSVCHANLSNGFRGVDVRVHAGALHCQNCYSKDGLSYSRV